MANDDKYKPQPAPAPAPSHDKAQPPAPDPRSVEPNYGDVALNLPPDWNRTNVQGDQAFMLTTVGHVNGVSDAYLRENPAARHQFQWVHPRDETRISTSRSRHYSFVRKGEWEKNPHLWEWDGEGYIVHNGQRLMARPESYYHAEEAQRLADQNTRTRPNSITKEEERIVAVLEKRGIIVTDERGRQLEPLPQQSTPPRRN